MLEMTKNGLSVLNPVLGYFAPVARFPNDVIRYRAKGLVGFCLFMALLVQPLFFILELINGSYDWKIWALPLSSLAFFVICLAMRQTKSHVFGYVLINSLGILVIFLRTIATGGVESPVLYWLAVIPLAATLGVSKRAGLSFFTICILVIACVVYHDVLGINVGKFDMSFATWFLSVSFNFVLIMSVCLFFLHERDRFEGIIRDNEKRLFASAKLATIGTFSTGVAKELYLPTKNINGQLAEIKSKLISRGYESNHPIFKSIENIELSNSRIKTISTSLSLGLNQTTPGKGNRSNLKVCLEAALAKIDTNHVDLHFSPPSEDQIVFGEYNSVLHVLQAVLRNGLDAALKTDMPWLRIEVFEQAYTVTVRVTDSGKGLSEDSAEHIFDPFYTTKEVGSGQGLGLSSSRTVLENFGGDLYYDSEHANTSFVIRFKRVVDKNQ